MIEFHHKTNKFLIRYYNERFDSLYSNLVLNLKLLNISCANFVSKNKSTLKFKYFIYFRRSRGKRSRLTERARVWYVTWKEKTDINFWESDNITFLLQSLLHFCIKTSMLLVFKLIKTCVTKKENIWKTPAAWHIVRV